MIARARGSPPVVMGAVDTSWAAKADRGQGWGEGSCPGLEGLRRDGLCLRVEAGPVPEGLREESGPILRVWERKHSPILG